MVYSFGIGEDISFDLALMDCCIEFHHRFPAIGLPRTLLAIRNAGYGIFDVSPSGEEFSFCLRKAK